MNINFHKFQGNGNDFILIDNRNERYQFGTAQIQRLCNRRFGIGADGLMLLSNSVSYDFRMEYFNSDGMISSMCGNGGRCIAAYAKLLGIADKEMIFDAYDGTHKAIVMSEIIEGIRWDIKLQLSDVCEVEKNKGYYFLNTGSPHYVEFVDKAAEVNVGKEGRNTRKSELFAPGGTNVNFVEISRERIFVRTYERGVEAETLSCGTGVTASAISVFLETGQKSIPIHTIGGDFSVDFNYDPASNKFTNIWLKGPAELVFSGELVI